jgi:indole-3-acetate monooxygenase
LYRIGIIGFAAICHSGWACGIGRRLLDEIAAKVRGGIGRAGTQASSETFHEEYAKAEAKYRAARALVYDAWGSVDESLDRGEPLTTRQHTMIRLAMANITWTCKDVADFAYKSAGTVALRAGTIQRLYRDMQAGTQHITSAPPVIRNAGRELAGLADGKRWLFLDLVE